MTEAAKMPEQKEGMHTALPWKWHRRSAEGEHNGAIYAEPISGHVYAVAMQPRYASDEQWAADAELIVTAVYSHAALKEKIETLEFNLAETQAEVNGYKHLIAQGVSLGDEDAGEGFASLTVETEGDPSVGIPNTAWLQIGKGYSVVRETDHAALAKAGTELADAAGDIHPTAPSSASIDRLHAAIDKWFAALQHKEAGK